MNGLHAGRFLGWLIGEPAADADDPIVDVDPELPDPD